MNAALALVLALAYGVVLELCLAIPISTSFVIQLADLPNLPTFSLNNPHHCYSRVNLVACLHFLRLLALLSQASAPSTVCT